MPVLTVPGVDLPSGETIPTLGQGTWHLGQGRHPRAEEIQALREGVDLGMTLIDTAEMYGDGRAEEPVGEAIAGRRDDLFLVSMEHPVVRGVAGRYRVSPARVALAWVLAQDGVCAIPEAGTVAHVRQNRASLDLRLDESDMVRLDEAFPPPLTPQPLEIL